MEYNVHNELRKFVAPEFIYGCDARLLVARYARKLGGRRVLLVSDPGVAAAGWTGEIASRLEEGGLAVELFLGVSPNPRDSEVMAGAEVFRANACDLIVAVGGGSPMDCAKGIGIVAANPGSILDFQGVDRVPAPMPPLICVPTTAGTSADVSQFAIINHLAERVKIAIISKAVVPDVALIDPRTLVTMDPYLTACTGMDALVHAIEAFCSNAASPVTDLHALEAIRLVHQNLRASVDAPDDLELRNRVMLASLHAGLAFSNASLGCVHAMAHSLGGFMDLPHGECNALLLAHVLDFNFASAPERFHRIAEALGCPLEGMGEAAARQRLVLHVRDLGRDCGIAPGLGRRGVRSADLPGLAAKAIDNPCNATNPRAPSREDLLSLYSEAM
jgi:alcohol dehydrogenase class IV